jgi:transcriptional regulator with GAF, ATPase, and Fis domain
MPRARTESDVSRRPATAPSFAPVEKAARDEPRLDRVLHDLAARAMQETGASSVAIGLGREGAMICCAVAGLSPANLGAPINTESGLTGMAIRRQMSQWCTDTESDLRVDVELCRQLGVRSIIVVPVRGRYTVVGLFAIFSVSPDAFSLDDLNTVKKLAHWAAEAIETTIENTTPREPAIAGPDDSGGKQLVGVDSERAHAGGIKNYVMRIQRAIVVALTALIGILRGRLVSPPTSPSDRER